MEEFATRLKRLMFIKGVRQVDLAKKTGINKGTLSHYMTGGEKGYVPKGEAVVKLANALGVTADYLLGNETISDAQLTKSELSKVPVLGKVAAGVPTFANQDIIDSILFDGDTEGLFGLKIKGDSMSPRIVDGDTVIVRSQSCAEDGDLVIALIDDETTCKVFVKRPWGVSLEPFNPVFKPIAISNNELDDLHILGVVVESRHQWC